MSLRPPVSVLIAGLAVLLAGAFLLSHGSGRYTFWGARGGERYMVEISAR